MIRIRRILSAAHNGAAVAEVQEIFRARFPYAAAYADQIPQILDQPFERGYRTVLVVAEGDLGKVRGFSMVLHFPGIRAAFLDFLAVAPGSRGGGVGSALYEATRELCRSLGCRGLYLEVAPDDPALVPDSTELSDNCKRLRFYEHYGVRPVVNTAYETPVGEGPGPHLLFDGLGRAKPLGRREAQQAVRLILERKYAHLVDERYTAMVVRSFRDHPVQFRAPRYVDVAQSREVAAGRLEQDFALVASGGHAIHHVKDRGYVERPVRVRALLETATRSGLFRRVAPRHFGSEVLRTVHDPDFVSYLKRVCVGLKGPTPVYPYVFPIRRPERKPYDLAVRAGYYCIDTFTPLSVEAYQAARGAVDVVLTATDEILQGTRVAYALCRPPGHHAERRVFGGFCYFNNAALAAQRLSGHGSVAVLDLDYHHGNGTQDIFYRRRDVLFCSLHGHPNFAYPYFSGFKDETGEGDGKGFNLNFPLPEDTDEARYLRALDEALQRIARFRPAYLVLSTGFDILRGDPTGTFSLIPSSMEKIGQRVAALGLPLLVVQEGGYNLRNLKRGLPCLFRGIARAVL